VHIEAQINSLQIRDRGFVFPDGTLITNRCDATAVCTTTP
jgi:hypothetical protein